MPASADSQVRVTAVQERLDGNTAAILLTKPNTCGLFENDMAIAEAVHAARAFCYLDGANFNALVGGVCIADLGVDAIHYLHKTFSTLHGSGEPGAGGSICAELSPVRTVALHPKEGERFYAGRAHPGMYL